MQRDTEVVRTQWILALLLIYPVSIILTQFTVYVYIFITIRSSVHFSIQDNSFFVPDPSIESRLSVSLRLLLRSSYHDDLQNNIFTFFITRKRRSIIIIISKVTTVTRKIILGFQSKSFTSSSIVASCWHSTMYNAYLFLPSI